VCVGSDAPLSGISGIKRFKIQAEYEAKGFAKCGILVLGREANRERMLNYCRVDRLIELRYTEINHRSGLMLQLINFNN